MWSTILPLLPLAAALQLPHFPSPQEALDVAGSLLHPGVTLTHGSDMTLSSVPTDDHLVVTSAMHPVRLKIHLIWYQETDMPELQAANQVA